MLKFIFYIFMIFFPILDLYSMFTQYSSHSLTWIWCNSIWYLHIVLSRFDALLGFQHVDGVDTVLWSVCQFHIWQDLHPILYRASYEFWLLCSEFVKWASNTTKYWLLRTMWRSFATNWTSQANGAKLQTIWKGAYIAYGRIPATNNLHAFHMLRAQ